MHPAVNIPPWLSNLSLGLGTTVGLLLLLEAAGFVAGIPPRSDDFDAMWRHRMHDCRYGRGHVEQSCSPSRVKAPEESVLVAVFGGSSVEGYPFGTRENFPRFLQDELGSAHPDRYVVRNLGRSCKESGYVRACMERAIDADPDVVVIYAGHNDFGALMVERPGLELLFSSHPWLVDVEGWRGESRGYALLISLAARLAPSQPGWHRLADGDFERTRRFVIERYVENLRFMLELAAERETPVILVTVVSNLYEFPFPREEWDEVADLEIDERMVAWHAEYQAGIELDRSGRYAEALAHFKEARDVFMKSRAPSALNREIRDLSAAYPHVLLVDFERQLEAVGAEEGIGCNFFGADSWCDQFHPNPRTARLLARALAETILGLPQAERG
jgi:lysophospholipase L1-like esterase